MSNSESKKRSHSKKKDQEDDPAEEVVTEKNVFHEKLIRDLDSYGK